MMSDYEDDEFDGTENDSDTNLVKDLRKQLKAQKKLQDDMATELATFRTTQRSANVAKLLQESGADPRYAKFYTAEDGSEEAVKAWIQSESELLGVQEAEEDDPVADQIRGISSAVAKAPSQRASSHAARIADIKGVKTRDELRAAIKTAFPNS